jgi:hypothetical protein
MWPTHQFLYDKLTHMDDWSIPNRWPPLMWSTRQSLYDSPTHMVDLSIFNWWFHSCDQLINLLTTTPLTRLAYWFSIGDPHSCDRLISFLTIEHGQLINFFFEFSYNSYFFFFSGLLHTLFNVYIYIYELHTPIKVHNICWSIQLAILPNNIAPHT